jgi:prepilin-type N-terminal cleavage/methylation domain-containing protein
MRTTKNRNLGFTLMEIMIVVMIIGLLASIAIPNWVHARTNSQTTTCINNLRQIDAAKQQWAIETKQATNATPAFSDIRGYLKSVVICPAGGPNATFASTYTIGNVATKPVCQIYPGTHMLPLDTSN